MLSLWFPFTPTSLDSVLQLGAGGNAQFAKAMAGARAQRAHREGGQGSARVEARCSPLPWRPLP
jgi:hypothetical protein